MEIVLNNQYHWNKNWQDAAAYTDINLVISELHDIQEVRGEVNAEFLLESAKNKKSVLYKYFNWDDADIAHKYRLRRAENLLNNIVVNVINDGKNKIIQSTEVIKINNGNNIYQKNKTPLIDNTFWAKSVVLSDLKRSIDRLSMYPEFSNTIVQINKAIEELSKEEPVDFKADKIKKLAAKLSGYNFYMLGS